jgi:hypothetical protein
MPSAVSDKVRPVGVEGVGGLYDQIDVVVVSLYLKSGCVDRVSQSSSCMTTYENNEQLRAYLADLVPIPIF